MTTIRRIGMLNVKIHREIMLTVLHKIYASEKQKDWVKSKLKEELLFWLRLQLESVNPSR